MTLGLLWLGLPAAQLVAVGAGGAALLTALYVLRQRRRRLEVPFSKLWQKVLRQTEATSLWQQLRRWLSLVLQIVILGLLVVALGDPRLSASLKGRTMVLLVDASASMQAIDGGGPARIDRAREAARRLVRDLAGDDVAVVVALDGQPAPRGGLSQDEHELIEQVDGVVARDEPADLPRALRLCRDLLAGRPNPQVVLVSDGGFDEAAMGALAAEVAGGLDVRYQALPPQPGAGTAGNLAITAFSVRRYRHNKLSYEVLLEVTSFPPPGGAGASVTTEVELQQEGETVDVQRLTIAPGERVQRLYPNLSGSGVHLVARLRGRSARDALPLDDTAYAMLPERQRLRLLVVTRGNLFLEGALLSAGAGEENQLQIDRVAPSGYSDELAARHDAVVFDDFTPAQPPAAHALYLNPTGAGSPIELAGTLNAPLVTDVAKDHPLLRWVTLKDLNISRASVFKLAPGDAALASMLRQPFVVAGERRVGGVARRYLEVGFDLRRSDLPLRVAFPVLLVNALDWFAGDTGSETQSYATGRTWRIPLAQGREAKAAGAAAAALAGVGGAPAAGGSGTVLLTTPAGERVPVPDYEGHALYHGSRVGFYEVQRAGAPLLIAANLADPTESAAVLRAELKVGGKALPPPETGRSAVRRVIWPYLLLLALGLLLIEWWTYQRRWTV